jgi:CRP-like cAMP-binding protein
MTSLASHPQRNSIRLQLRQNLLLQGISPAQWSELEPLLNVADYRKGDPLARQGDEEMEQFFILEGMLKRVVSNPEGREMILRFAAETEMDTSYAAWRLRTPVPYSIVAVTKVRIAELPMPLWVEFLERNTDLKLRFEY